MWRGRSYLVSKLVSKRYLALPLDGLVESEPLGVVAFFGMAGFGALAEVPALPEAPVFAPVVELEVPVPAAVPEPA